MGIDFLKLIEKYGFHGIFATILILIIGGVIRSKWFVELWSKGIDKIVDWYLKKRTKNPADIVNESNITNHDIFNYIDFWTYSRVPAIKFSTDYRTIVFRKYLTTYLGSYKKELRSLVDSGKYKEMDESEFWKTFLNTINNIVMQYERDAEDIGIPKTVIQKMKVKNNDTIQLTMDLIENISTSKFYESEDNLLKIYSILNILLSVLENTIVNSEGVCNAINGEMKGYSIKDGGNEYKEP